MLNLVQRLPYFFFSTHFKWSFFWKSQYFFCFRSALTISSNPHHLVVLSWAVMKKVFEVLRAGGKTSVSVGIVVFLVSFTVMNFYQPVMKNRGANIQYRDAQNLLKSHQAPPKDAWFKIFTNSNMDVSIDFSIHHWGLPYLIHFLETHGLFFHCVFCISLLRSQRWVSLMEKASRFQKTRR